MPMIKSKKISTEDKLKNQLGVGMLLYLVKHSWPDIANMTRGLFKANDSANSAAFKEILGVIKNVLFYKKF